MRTHTLTLLAALAVVAAALLAAACGGGSDTDPQSATSTAVPTSATSSSTEVASTSPSPDAATPSSTSSPGATTESLDYATFYTDNCAVCHGANRDGVGRVPALTPDELTHEVAEYLEETDDRTHRSIWTRTELDEAAREALFEYLATTPP